MVIDTIKSFADLRRERDKAAPYDLFPEVAYIPGRVHPEQQYLNLTRELLSKGEFSSNRTGVPTISLFGRLNKFDLSQGFSLLTTKDTHWPSIVHELLWFLKGDTNIRYLVQNKVH